MGRNHLRRLIAAGIMALAAPALAKTGADEAAVMAQERAWSAAFLAHDLRKLSAIISDDFVGIDGRGVVSHKADELAEAAPPKPGDTAPQIVREVYSDMKVRLYGRTAVLNDINTATFANKDGERVIRYRRTTVWTKRRAGWRVVSFHASRLPD